MKEYEGKAVKKNKDRWKFACPLGRASGSTWSSLPKPLLLPSWAYASPKEVKALKLGAKREVWETNLSDAQ